MKDWIFGGYERDGLCGDAMNRVCTVMWGNLEIIKNGYGKI